MLAKQGGSVNLLASDDPAHEVVEIRLALDLRETPAQYYRLRVNTN